MVRRLETAEPVERRSAGHRNKRVERITRSRGIQRIELSKDGHTDFEDEFSGIPEGKSAA